MIAERKMAARGARRVAACSCHARTHSQVLHLIMLINKIHMDWSLLLAFVRIERFGKRILYVTSLTLFAVPRVQNRHDAHKIFRVPYVRVCVCKQAASDVDLVVVVVTVTRALIVDSPRSSFIVDAATRLLKSRLHYRESLVAIRLCAADISPRWRSFARRRRNARDRND